ncbi:PREDICTED: aspartic and glutamic acid-rich protein-like [Ipomoea nil]|uniref:aspartic and glutamic acid-rich protein-like n=1 Tax=Ipomoea nil TaxID=35883 RepID=UPI0009011CD9|nr:PREDICTED: aspartic and glutamic acid-rich protein-like [Ipomoea nil]
MKRKISKKRKNRSKSSESLKKSSLPQEPIQAEQLNTSLTQEPAAMEKGAQGSRALDDHLSLPHEPGVPEEMREVVTEPNVETTLPQEPTRTEQMAPILTQEPVRVDEDEIAPHPSSHLSFPQEPGQPAETREVTPPIKSNPKEDLPEPEVLQESVIPENSQAIVSVPEAVPIPPSKDQMLRESIENNFNRVMQRQKWRTSPLQTFLETFEEMKDEEEFALEWIGTKDVYEALRLETIKRVYSYKVTHRTLGKEKVPIYIELNKPPLDPAFVEEMKEFRYALFLSKVKTELERTHQNDPACNVSGLKDDEGKEIEHEDESTSENETSEANSDSDNGTDENPENEEDDEDEDEKSGDEQDDSHGDGGDDDDDDEGKADNNNLGDDGSDDDDNDDGNSDYDSESPIIGNTEDIPERSPAPSSSPPKECPTRELPLAMLPPLPDTARDDNMDASPRDENREASRHALDQEPGMDYLSPEHIMHQMLNTVFNAELIHKQYLHHREKDSRNIADLSAKVDRMMQTMSRPQPNTSIPDTQDRLAHELSQQRAILDKIAKEQHALKLAHFGLKE